MPKKVLLYMMPNAIVQCHSLPISLSHLLLIPLSLVLPCAFALEPEALLSISIFFHCSCISCLGYSYLSLYHSLSLSLSLFLSYYVALCHLVFFYWTRSLCLSNLYKLLMQFFYIFIELIQKLKQQLFNTSKSLFSPALPSLSYFKKLLRILFILLTYI